MKYTLGKVVVTRYVLYSTISSVYIKDKSGRLCNIT